VYKFEYFLSINTFLPFIIRKIAEMEQRIFHGTITTNDIAQSLISEFNHGNLRAQQFGKGKRVLVQIATHHRPTSGGHTAISIDLRQVEDGVSIQIGKQSWMGVAASFGQTALEALRNPWRLIYRLDDLAQDYEYLQLSDDIWSVIESTANAHGATFELSERLRRVVCPYCITANPVGEPNCIACGAPLGKQQPRTCQYCGFAVKTNEQVCPNCGKPQT
jgi:DNA-directed RNA polymerase subunit RPC12/RpoP